MKDSKLFKILFWVLTLVVIGFIGFAISKVVNSVSDMPEIPVQLILGFSVPVLFVLTIFSAIAIFVYKDAGRRGMDRWMWMTIATFVPNLIGLIVYVIVRNNYGARCVSCGKNVRNDFDICPYCGTSLKAKCPQCGKQVASDWKICPYCSRNL